MPLNTANSHILEDNAQEEKGEHARLSSFIGALAITDLIKTTLGPKGMDKILQSTSERGETQVTNDGATILKSIHIDNPAAKILVETSKIQDDQVGDGTTSVCVLSGELLREAEQLLAKNIHPQIIISGWRKAQDIALKALDTIAFNNLNDPVKLRHDLLTIAKTTLSSKILSQEKDHFANLAVDAVLRLKGSTNLDSIHIIKKSGGSLRDSFLDEGYILEKKIGVGQPKRLENPKILVANTAMDTDKIKIYGAKVKADSPQEIANIEASERERMLQKCEQIAKHGINCFINRQLIYNLPEQYFTDHGIMAIEHADFEGIERLALVLGSEIVSTFDNPELVKLGSCKLIEEIIIAEDRFIKFSGVAVGSACTIVLRGSSTHLLDEAERSLHDALSVLSQIATEPKVVYGGGCAEVHMAKHVDQQAALTAGKEAIALEAYARALRAIPTIIANNGGYDSAQLVSELRAAHNNGFIRAGLDMDNGKVEDMEKIEIYDSWKVKRNIVTAASETAELILRADAIFKAAPRRRE